MLSEEAVSPDVLSWIADLQEQNTLPSTSRDIAGSILTREFDSILYGPIVDYSFRNLETLSDCVKLTPRSGFRPNQYTDDKKLKSCSLRLSHNRLCEMTGLDQLIPALLVEPERLFWIDLSFNTFPSIDPVLLKLTRLQILNLHANQISELFEVDKLVSLNNLRNLTLHGNPMEQTKGYRSYVVEVIPQLKTLDYSLITKQDRSTAAVFKKFIKRKHVARRKYD
ncbi:leucine rich repeat containing 51 [Scyliorhinus canicula]|uniref:leucine rich repeat containing 51 n=1 Tax=Scyliorhinus canicula TaxID=7830 RepID=UPI0018F62E69|nr:leucine rich repeat containing 51 [Scyliorhinus canicula]